MADSLDWLKVGADAAFISGRGGSETVSKATVLKVGKRDVAVMVDGREEKFNINHTDRRNDALWLHRRSFDSWAPSIYLAPFEDPEVVKIRNRQRRDRAVYAIRDKADLFLRSPDIQGARTLQTAIDVFLQLHEKDES